MAKTWIKTKNSNINVTSKTARRPSTTTKNVPDMKLYTRKRDTNFRRSNTSVLAVTLLVHSKPPKIGKTTRTTRPTSTNSNAKTVEIPSLAIRNENNTLELALVSRGT